MVRGQASPASNTLPIAASSFSSAVASALANAALPRGRCPFTSPSLAALRRLGQSRCQCVPPQWRHFV
eukprot:5628110-Pleurochrysis_carterae.AAC.1